jgi:mono/diheme cytochrome c family protein
MKGQKTKFAVVAFFGLAALAAVYSAARAQDQTSRTTWDGVYTADQEKRGDALFAQTCASCHGVDLGGKDEAPALAGGTFLADWDGLTVGDLSDRISKTMPQDNPGHLTRQQVADIITHILKANGFPAGKEELNPAPERESQILIQATKPKSESD